MRAAVFLERDGVLNRSRSGSQRTPLTLDDFEIAEEASLALQGLKSAGFVLLATTNQPGLSNGHLSRRELDLMHSLLRKRFPLDDILVCPHAEMDGCPCRKPKPGLLREAAYRWQLDLDRSFVISDKWQDAAAAHSAGCTSVLIRSPLNGSGHRDFLVGSIEVAVHKILQMQLGQFSQADAELARI